MMCAMVIFPAVDQNDGSRSFLRSWQSVQKIASSKSPIVLMDMPSQGMYREDDDTVTALALEPFQ
jgi:hypothetical protein